VCLRRDPIPARFRSYQFHNEHTLTPTKIESHGARRFGFVPRVDTQYTARHALLHVHLTTAPRYSLTLRSILQALAAHAL